jgi:hypothetical protein
LADLANKLPSVNGLYLKKDGMYRTRSSLSMLRNTLNQSSSQMLILEMSSLKLVHMNLRQAFMSMSLYMS